MGQQSEVEGRLSITATEERKETLKNLIINTIGEQFSIRTDNSFSGVCEENIFDDFRSNLDTGAFKENEKLDVEYFEAEETSGLYEHARFTIDCVGVCDKRTLGLYTRAEASENSNFKFYHARIADTVNQCLGDDLTARMGELLADINRSDIPSNIAIEYAESDDVGYVWFNGDVYEFSSYTLVSALDNDWAMNEICETILEESGVENV